MPAISAQAPAKTILFGEHAVVYGFPAIAVPIHAVGTRVTVLAKPDQNQEGLFIYHTDTRKRVSLAQLETQHPTRLAIETVLQSLQVDHNPTIEIQIASSIPVAAGLGSSAAFAVALTRGISHFLGFSPETKTINDIAFKIEQHIHGSPSGIDNTVIAYDRPVFFSKNNPPEFMEITQPINLVIADSGERTLTKKVVSEVKERRNHDRAAVDAVFSEIDYIVKQAKEQMQNGNEKEIGSLMNENHKLLVKLGVSSSILDRLCQTAIQSGASGAKLCGGGKGGIITALVDGDSKEQVKSQLLQAGAAACFIDQIKPH